MESSLALGLTSLAGVIGTVLLLSQEIPQLPGAVKAVVATVNPARHPGSHIVFVSNDEFLAKSYLSLLADSGARAESIDTSQIDSLPHMNPDLVIFGSGAPEPERLKLSDSVRTFLEGDVKVMGIGSLGSFMLEQVEPFSPIAFRHAIGVQTSDVKLDNRVDKRFVAGLPTTGTFKLYEEDGQSPASGLAVFDQGSLPLLGATGIAELSDTGGCNGHTWPVARQGNDLFWGYSLPGTALTPEGTRLFTNVVLAVLQDDFQKPQQQQHYKEPGSYNGDALGCLFSTNEYRLPVSAVGAIDVVVRSKEDIQVTITGPRAIDSYSAHGISPRLLVPVTREALAAGEDWVITISYSGPMSSRTRINYDLTLNYPSQASSPAMAALLALFLLLTCLLGLVSTFYLVRSRPVFRSWGRSLLSILPFRR